MVERNQMTSGLAGLLQGMNSGMENRRTRDLQEKQLSMKDPNRPIGTRDYLDILGKAYSTQAAYPSLPGYEQKQIDPAQLIAMVKGLQQAIANPQASSVPIQPPAQAAPQTPTPVDRGGGGIQAIADEMRRRGLMK